MIWLLPTADPAGQVRGAASKVASGHCGVAPRVDAEADRKVDADGLQFVHRGFARRFVLDDELGEADGRVPRGLFEELRRRGDAAGRRVHGAGAGLPAAVGLRVVRVRGGDYAGGACPGGRGPA